MIFFYSLKSFCRLTLVTQNFIHEKFCPLCINMHFSFQVVFWKCFVSIGTPAAMRLSKGTTRPTINFIFLHFFTPTLSLVVKFFPGMKKMSLECILLHREDANSIDSCLFSETSKICMDQCLIYRQLGTLWSRPFFYTRAFP